VSPGSAEHRQLPEKRTSGFAGTAGAESSRRLGFVERCRRFATRLGPGFIAGVADNDPSCIGTYAVAGATLGLAPLWLAPLVWPMGAAVQTICSRLGMVGGRGLADLVARNYPRALLYPIVAAVVVANTVTLGADITAIIDAAGLLVGRGVRWLTVPLVALLLTAQTFLDYGTISKLLKFLTLALFAYVAATFAISTTWGEIGRALIPRWSAEPHYIDTIVALLGAALSPYLFFWQASQEVEQERCEGRTSIHARRGAAPAEVRRANLDVLVGMAVPSVLMFAVIATTAATLHQGNTPTLASAADAAKALEPLVGRLAGGVFALGLIGTGLLAVPVLSSSAAYAVAEVLRWRHGLNEPWQRAKRFYALIAVCTIGGALIVFTGVQPIRALFLSSLLNGLITPPLLVLVILLGRSRRVMADQPIGAGLTALAVATAGLVWVSLVLFIFSRL
jgi:NRAMP (natural resistance-associated macrophage protein)-like metal ion transporter